MIDFDVQPILTWAREPVHYTPRPWKYWTALQNCLDFDRKLLLTKMFYPQRSFPKNGMPEVVVHSSRNGNFMPKLLMFL